jgi:hypothetical protein
MNTARALKRIVAGVLLSGGVAVAGFGVAGGTAQAGPSLAPQYRGPFGAGGPYHWCPGDDPKGGPGQPFTNRPNWDWNICHTYYVVPAGKGNVSPGIWDGDNPPPPPHWPPPPWAP